MAFLTTADSGQYSPPLSIRAGVHYCAQTIVPDSGRLLLRNTETYNPNWSNLGSLKYQNARINGRYSLEDNFEQGYFNFENWSGRVCYDTQWSKSGYQSVVGTDNKPYLANFWGRGNSAVSTDALYKYNFESNGTTAKQKNITTSVVMSGVAGGPYNKMEVYNGTLTSGNITVYGRVGVSNTSFASEDKILGFISPDTVVEGAGNTGWLLPTAAYDGAEVWTNENNILLSDGNVATATADHYESAYGFYSTGFIHALNYEFDLTGYTITSVDVLVDYQGMGAIPFFVGVGYNGGIMGSTFLPYQNEINFNITSFTSDTFYVAINFRETGGGSTVQAYLDSIKVRINYVSTGEAGFNLLMKDAGGGNRHLQWKSNILGEEDYVGINAIPIENNNFSNFLFTYSNSTGYGNFYYGKDDEPLTLRSVDYLGDISAAFTGTASFYEESHANGSPNNPKIISDFGISNRLWTSDDIYEFNQHRLNPSYYLTENILSNPPVASGSDIDCLNFHFPVKSSGTLGSCNSTNYNATNYYIPLTSGISDQLYEFDRSQYNPTALSLDMWVENTGSNPSGNLSSRIDFCDRVQVGGKDLFTVKQYWSGFPIQINNDGIHQVRMSGLVYNEYHGLSDLAEVNRNRGKNAQLYYGAWYDNIHAEYNGDIKIYSARCNIGGWCTPLSTGNYMTLYTSGQIKTIGQLDLYLANNYIDNQLDLYIKGVNPVNSGCTLYMNAGFKFDTTTLFIGGKDSQSGDMTLYVEGGTAKAEMPLYLYSQPASEMSGNIPLSIWATEHSGSSKGMTMYIGENAPSGVVSAGMNLYTRGPYSNRLTSNMNLFLRSETPRGDSSCTLYCANYYTGASGTLTLFMKAPSGTLGAIPVSGNMNLFISRDSESTAHNLPLSISGPKSSEGALELAITGSTPNYSSIPLSVDGLGVGTQTIKFYINGF